MRHPYTALAYASVAAAPYRADGLEDLTSKSTYEVRLKDYLVLAETTSTGLRLRLKQRSRTLECSYVTFVVLKDRTKSRKHTTHQHSGAHRMSRAARLLRSGVHGCALAPLPPAARTLHPLNDCAPMSTGPSETSSLVRSNKGVTLMAGLLRQAKSLRRNRVAYVEIHILTKVHLGVKKFGVTPQNFSLFTHVRCLSLLLFIFVSRRTSHGGDVGKSWNDRTNRTNRLGQGTQIQIKQVYVDTSVAFA